MNNFDSISVELSNRSVDQTEFSPRDVIAIAKEIGFSKADAYKYVRQFPQVRRGLYDMSAAVVPLRSKDEKIMEKPLSSAVQSIVNDEVYVPNSNDCYVAWGNSKDVQTIIKSRRFFPTYISGLSGNGKTLMVEQNCANLNREYVRVQITPETDEDDLLGGFRLINGETVFAKGPVVKAMEAGAILLIDEIDRGSNKIMCLQGVLEGKPIMIKKTGEVVYPKPGFNVIATANTKGRGSDDGRYVAATIIDDAFLERFPNTIEQGYPKLTVERKIINNHLAKYDSNDTSFAELLAVWSETIRKTYDDGGIDEQITTRRLCHIAETYSIFNDRKKAITMCIARFDDDVKEAFLDLYEKVDASLGEALPEVEEVDRETGIEDAIAAAFE